jgi:hypothetical protein
MAVVGKAVMVLQKCVGSAASAAAASPSQLVLTASVES